MVVNSMERKATASAWLLLAPEILHLERCFLPDPFRARLAARCARLAERGAGEGPAIGFHGGAGGETARVVAEEVHRRGARFAVVAGRAWDRAAASALARALEERGVEVHPPLWIVPGEEEARIREGAAWLEAKARGAGPVAREGVAAPVLHGGWMVTTAGVPRPSGGILFHDEGNRLVRVGEDPAPGIPSEVREIRLLRAGEKPTVREADRPAVLWAMALPPLEAFEAEGASSWIDRIATAAAAHAGRFRLLPRAPRILPRTRGESTLWTVPYGMDRPAGRAFLRSLGKRLFPELLPWLRILAGFAETGVDPLEEMYAGNALPDRNEALLEVILS